MQICSGPESNKLTLSISTHIDHKKTTKNPKTVENLFQFFNHIKECKAPSEHGWEIENVHYTWYIIMIIHMETKHLLIMFWFFVLKKRRFQNMDILNIYVSFTLQVSECYKGLIPGFIWTFLVKL